MCFWRDLVVLIWKITRLYSRRCGEGASKLVSSYPNRIQNTSISRDRLECGDVSEASQCPRTVPFDTPFISLFVASRQLRWCDVQILDKPLSTPYERVYGIVNISEPKKTHRMAGHAAQEALACHINTTCSTGSEAVSLPIIGFSKAAHHYYDAEVVGPLKGPLK